MTEAQAAHAIETLLAIARMASDNHRWHLAATPLWIVQSACPDGYTAHLASGQRIWFSTSLLMRYQSSGMVVQNEIERAVKQEIVSHLAGWQGRV